MVKPCCLNDYIAVKLHGKRVSWPVLRMEKLQQSSSLLALECFPSKIESKSKLQKDCSFSFYSERRLPRRMLWTKQAHKDYSLKSLRCNSFVMDACGSKEHLTYLNIIRSLMFLLRLPKSRFSHQRPCGTWTFASLLWSSPHFATRLPLASWASLQVRRRRPHEKVNSPIHRVPQKVILPKTFHAHITHQKSWTSELARLAPEVDPNAARCISAEWQAIAPGVARVPLSSRTNETNGPNQWNSWNGRCLSKRTMFSKCVCFVGL